LRQALDHRPAQVRSNYQGAPSSELKFADNYLGYGWSPGALRATVPLNRDNPYTDLIDYVGTRHVTWPGTRSVGVCLGEVLPLLGRHLRRS
jgi:hypothetical protein